MDIQQITDKIANMQRAIKTATTVALKNKLKSKIAELKEDLKNANVPTSKLAKSLLGSQRKVANYTKAEFKSAIKTLAKRDEYSFLKRYTIGEIEDDRERYAKPVGWRFKGRNNIKKPTAKELAIGKARGTVYYESRPNRSDVVRPVKLAKGGSLNPNSVEQENIDMVKNQAIQVEHHAKELMATLKSNPRVDAWVVAKMDRATQNLSDITHYLDGEEKSYAKGGLTEHGLKVGDTIISKGRKSNEIVGVNRDEHELFTTDLDKGKRDVQGMYFKKGGDVMPFEKYEAIHEEIHENKYEKGGSVANAVDKHIATVKASEKHGYSIGDYKMAHKHYAKGGQIGDSGLIEDPNSLYKGKMGVIVGESGNHFLVKTINGTGLVKKTRIKIIADDYYAKGGMTKREEDSEYVLYDLFKNKAKANYSKFCELALKKGYSPIEIDEWYEEHNEDEYAKGGNITNELNYLWRWSGSLTVNEIIEIIDALIDAGITDEDLKIKTPKKLGGSRYRELKDKKAPQIWQKAKPFYKGNLEGNMYFQVVTDLIHLSMQGKTILEDWKINPIYSGVNQNVRMEKQFKFNDDWRFAKGGVTKKEFVGKKVGQVMHEFKQKNLHIGTSGKIVKKRKQAVAIALNVANEGWKHRKKK
jgi:ribosomal protein L21E